jgi:hypothetical protein
MVKANLETNGFEYNLAVYRRMALRLSIEVPLRVKEIPRKNLCTRSGAPVGFHIDRLDGCIKWLLSDVAEKANFFPVFGDLIENAVCLGFTSADFSRFDNGH